MGNVPNLSQALMKDQSDRRTSAKSSSSLTPSSRINYAPVCCSGSYLQLCTRATIDEMPMPHFLIE
jgi:hypothetical protein